MIVHDHHPGQELALVERELRRQLDQDPEPVRAPMRRLLEAGGKRLRPLLVSLSSRLGPGHDPSRAAVLGAAVELIHNATLVHDDYVDQATLRRGRPAIAAAEGPARAIAVGDYYFARATGMIAALDHTPVTRTIAAALESICLAQIAEVRLRGRYPGDLASYLDVVRGKTAALFAAACQAGAELAGASAEVTERLRSYGDRLGIAFQIVDDLLDYSHLSGKPLGTDIRQRTVSLPLIYASCSPAVGSELCNLLAVDPDDSTVARVQELVKHSGALTEAGAEARSMARQAASALDQSGLDSASASLIEVAAQVVDRVN